MITGVLIFLLLFTGIYPGICWYAALMDDRCDQSILLPNLRGCHPEWRLLLFVTCFWLSILVLADTLIYLILVRQFAVSQVMWLTVLLLYRILIMAAVIVKPQLIRQLRKWMPYCGSVYGTAVTVFLGIAVLACFTYNTKDFSSLLTMWGILTVVLFLRIVLALSHIRYRREKELLSTIEVKNMLLEKNYAAVNHAYTVNARLFHDFHRHLEILRQLARKAHDLEILEYIESISGPLQEISEICWTGDETVDYIINTRYAKAKENGISMEVNIEYPSNTNIRSDDLCTILSNLLDNAVEGASRSGMPCEPIINLKIRRIQNILVIKLENTSPAPVYRQDGSLDSVKSDHTLHGWGMENIETTVDKYDGAVQTFWSDNIFQTTVTLSFDGVRIK